MITKKCSVSSDSGIIAILSSEFIESYKGEYDRKLTYPQTFVHTKPGNYLVALDAGDMGCASSVLNTKTGFYIGDPYYYWSGQNIKNWHKILNDTEHFSNLVLRYVAVLGNHGMYKVTVTFKPVKA